MLLQIATRTLEPSITVVEMTGRLALGRESQQVETLVSQLLRDGATRLIYDLSNLAYTDSTGIGIIAFSAGQVRKSGGEVRIAGAKGVVLQALNISGLDAILSLDPSVDDAVRALADRGASSGAA